jgi:hypothetical protein
VPVLEPRTQAISAKQFLAEASNHLKIGDIVLSRSPTLSSWLIRWAIGAEFSHAALVFLVAQPEEGFNSTFLLESVSSGVRIVNLRDYIGGRKPHADVAVLRLEGDGLTESYFKKVRGLMLDHVNSGYDFNRVMRLGLSANFGMRLGWSVLARGKSEGMREAIMRTRRRLHKWVPPQFICSGFIQYGLAKAAELMNISTNVMLKEDVSRNDRDAILAVTPDDVARSERLKWRYVIRRGFVHDVVSYQDALRVLR